MSKIIALDTDSGGWGVIRVRGIRNTKDKEPCLEENRTKITEEISYKCLKE